jgi:threonine aldolase
LKVHLDGARIFNAAVCLGETVAEITEKFDSVQFCLSKGLGAPVGSMIVGSNDFIARCRVIRKMLGGGMRQVGVLAAAGIVALAEGPKRLRADHENAQILARGLATIPGVGIDPAKVQTNIVMFDLSKTALTPAALVNGLGQRGVLGGAIDAARVRLVTHRDVSREDCERAVGILGEVLGAGF